MTIKQIISVILFIILISACNKQPKGRMVDLGGYKLHIYDIGNGNLTIILESGLGDGLKSLNIIQKGIAGFTRVISYDRAGIGKSDISPLPCTYENMVKQLKLMLTAEQIPPPYILVGISMGGNIIRLFTNTYPEDVVGLVLVDASHEDFLDKIKENRTEEELYKIDSIVNNLFSQESEIIKDEWEAYKKGRELMKNVEIPTDIPIRVITSAKYEGNFKEFIPEEKVIWLDLHSEWVLNNPHAKHIVTDKSGHAIYREEPQLVISSIKEIIDEIKTIK